MVSSDYIDPELRPAGPGTLKQQAGDPVPMLDGLTDEYYVDIWNPLPVSFVARFATTKAVNAPARIVTTPQLSTQVVDERSLSSMYGLSGFKNPDREGRLHVTQDTEIRPGETKRFVGGEAQVVMKQLIVEVMSRRGDKSLMSDPTARRKLEEELVMGHGLVQDLMNRSVMTPLSQPRDIAKEESHVESEEIEFAGLANSSTNDRTVGDGLRDAADRTGDPNRELTDRTTPRPPGRPRKTV